MDKFKVRTQLHFTLVELLVVISILAVLASLLSLSLSKAINTSNSLVCKFNQKSIGAVVYNFAFDHYDNLPPLRNIDDSSCDYYTYRKDGLQAECIMPIIQAYDQNFPMSDPKGGPDWFNPRGPHNKIFLCPSDLDPLNILNPIGGGIQNWKIVSFGFNAAAWAGIKLGPGENWWGDRYFIRTLNISRIAQPNKIVSLADAGIGYANQRLLLFDRQFSNVTMGVKNSNNAEMMWENSNELLLRHANLGYNVLYFDGHSEEVSFPDYPLSFVAECNRDNNIQ